MKSNRVDLAELSCGLEEQCPFIDFTLLGGADNNGIPLPDCPLELFVCIDPATAVLIALERVLPVLDKTLPGVPCDVIVLNGVDPATRCRALRGNLLFVKPGRESFFPEFRDRSSLDFRVLRAQMRRSGTGITD